MVIATRLSVGLGLAVAFVGGAAGAARADVAFVNLTGRVAHSGLIGGTADILTWDLETPFGVASPMLPADGGPVVNDFHTHTGNPNNFPFSTEFFGSAAQNTHATADYTFNGASGFSVAASVGVSTATVATGSISFGENVQAAYTFRFSVDTDTPYTFIASGIYTGVTNRVVLLSDTFAYYADSLGMPDGPLSFSQTGVLPAGTYTLAIGHNFGDSGNTSSSFNTTAFLSVGDAVPAPAAAALLTLSAAAGLHRRRR
ncbi:MAG: hypothetical protein ACKVS8_08120 [Phycisphaerales bacterium]